MSLFKGSIFAVLLLCLGCAAQSPANSDLDRRIERQVRTLYEDRLPPDVQVAITGRKASDIPNYDQVTVTFTQGAQKQSQEFLVSKDGKTLARFAKWDISKDPYAETMSKINTSGRPFKGNKDAKVVIVNYDDFQCPFCSRMHQTMNVIMKQYGDRVKLVYKDFPLVEIHPWAMRASMAANCLFAQSTDAYWSFADYLHAHGAEISGERRDVKEAEGNVDKAAREQVRQFNLDSGKLDACLAKPDETAIRASIAEATQLGVQATPTMFINGERIGGALPAKDLEVIINRALRDAGGQPAPAAAAAAAAAPSDAAKQ
ncbi:MAG TPA: thioredoxin domain-containing protein [Terriglobales bacterium]|nr:thioredoxin domain-containing protein [Terriglobales bacterium]